MDRYVEAWEIFSDEYRTNRPNRRHWVSWLRTLIEHKSYRSSRRNWTAYFNRVQLLVDEAMDLVDEGELLEAHEVLELVRTTMRDFRRRNGFRKFITDQLTAFHTIMGISSQFRKLILMTPQSILFMTSIKKEYMPGSRLRRTQLIRILGG